MALVIYSNGIVEDFKASANIFTEEELNSCFESYTTLYSIRLIDVPNTWCLWGAMDNPPDLEYNKIGSEIVESDIWSHLILIHDSELNLDWKLTDDIIYKSYKEYTVEIGNFINSIVSEIHEDSITNSNPEDTVTLIARGQTSDKRVIFEYNHSKQSDGFIQNGFPILSDKILEYIKTKFDVNITVPDEPLIIFADTKSIFIVNHDNTESFFDAFLDEYTKKEDYENSGYIVNTRAKWRDYTRVKSGYTKDNKEYRNDSITKSSTNKGRSPKNNNINEV